MLESYEFASVLVVVRAIFIANIFFSKYMNYYPLPSIEIFFPVIQNH